MLSKLTTVVGKVRRMRLPNEPLGDYTRRVHYLFRLLRTLSHRKISSDDIRAVVGVLKSGKISFGPQVRAFEKEFARLYGVKQAAASSSGTAAVHLALAMVGVEPGDEVIVPPITDMGSILPILAMNAIPIFADIDPETWTISPSAVAAQITPRTRAIIAVHLFGNPCDLDGLRSVIAGRDIKIIEDCAQAHWAHYKGRPVGTVGDAGAFSLQWTKHITSCEGGISLTNDPAAGERGRLFADKGWNRGVAGGRQYPIFGLNYRLSEMQAALARSQLRRVKAIVGGRATNVQLLREQLGSLPGITFQKVMEGCAHAYWLVALTVDSDAPFTADALVAALARRKFPCSAHYIGRPIHLCHYPLLSRRVFGSSNLPFSLSDERASIDYSDFQTPVAQDVLNRLVILGAPNEHFDASLVNDIAKEIRTVVDQLSVPTHMQVKPAARYRLGVIGCGNISKAHLESLRGEPAMKVTAIADVNNEALTTVGSLFGVEARYRDYQEMLAKEQLDAVLISVWPAMHAEVTLAAAARGVRAILCEKPIASNLGEARLMLEKTSQAGSLLVIGHQHTFNPNLVRARELIAAGEIGAVKHVWAHCRSSLINNGSHVVDGLLYMLGRPKVEWVFGQVQRVKNQFDRDQAVEDSSMGIIALENGIRINLEMGEAAVQEIGWQFAGELGKIDVDITSVKVIGRSHRKPKTYTDTADAMRLQFGELVRCLDDSSKVHRGAAEHGYAALEVLMGLLESARVGEVVRMPVKQLGYPLDLAPAKAAPASDAPHVGK